MPAAAAVCFPTGFRAEVRAHRICPEPSFFYISLGVQSLYIAVDA